MTLTTADSETLAVCAALTALGALLTVVLSALFGSGLAFQARPSLRYGVALALLFAPFAMGSSVWAYTAARLASWSGFQAELLASGTSGRAIVLLVLCLGKSVPLGVFFCAITLQRYTSEISAYLQVHRMPLLFFVRCALNRLPRSTLLLVGLFGGAILASEAALPTFLYRANPGTQPETANIMLWRLFREIYASSGPQSLPQIASLGMVVSIVLMASALLGSSLGIGILRVGDVALGCLRSFTGFRAVAFAGGILLGAELCMLPGFLGLLGLLASAPGHHAATVLERVLSYSEIIMMGALVGGSIVASALAIAIRLRYGERDLLARIERAPIIAGVLLLPAFVPALSIVAALGMLSNGQLTSTAAYASLFVSQFALHYPILQFICVSLVAGIPEHHVAWQRAARLHYTFSLRTDGFMRFSAVLAGLVGLCIVQVVADGSVSRWFSHLIKSPEEALYAASFGRLSNAGEAALIAWSIALIAAAVCSTIALAFVRDLAARPRHG